MHHFSYRDGAPPRRGRRSRRDRARRSARRSIAIPRATHRAPFPRVPRRLRRAGRARLLRDEGQFQPGGADDAGAARRRHGRRVAKANCAARAPPACRGPKIIFSGVGKTRAEMALGLDEDIRCFNVESEPELEALSEVAVSPAARPRPDRHPRQPGRRRAHPRQDLHRQVGEQVRRADLARPRGLCARPGAARRRGRRRRHAYRLADHRPRAVRRRLRAARRFRHACCAPTATRSTMSISAAVSAFPIASTTNRRRIPKRYAEIVARRTAGLDCEVFLEPGRLIVGNAGVLVTSVIYVKHGEGKNFVIVDAAMNDLIRPTLYDAHHEIRPFASRRPTTARDRRRRRRPGLRERRLSRARPRHARAARRAICSRS